MSRLVMISWTLELIYTTTDFHGLSQGHWRRFSNIVFIDEDQTKLVDGLGLTPAL